MMVLVVDDEESLCELLAEILAEQYDVIKAYNGKEALELARQKRPDLIISDVMMPQMSGVELLQALRADPATQDTPVILLSAASPQSVAEQAEAFIRKPFEVEVLERVVENLAQGKKNSSDSDIDNKYSNTPFNIGYHNQPQAMFQRSLPEMNSQRTFKFNQSQQERPKSC